MSEIRCDILICGGGLAGLSLLYRAMKAGIWTSEQIVVIDKAEKEENDKTWSFWKKGAVDFEEIIYHHWDNLYFFSHGGEQTQLETKGYTYNSIRSIDFYKYVLTYLRQFDTITFVKDDIIAISSVAEDCKAVTTTGVYTSKYLFNSVYHVPEATNGEQYFMQHFKGWRIRTDSGLPAASDAYLMDFRTGQEHGTTFLYTLPISADEVFVEYTLFTKSLLAQDEYDRKIRTYLADVLKIDTYEILEEEFGIIPMTDHVFKRFDGHIIHIGTAGGDTRASTGYTFINTQKTITRILDSYRREGHPFFKKENTTLKHQLYDSTLLNVLDKGKYRGHQVFADLFSKSPAYFIFPFLDAEASIFQDMRIMTSLRVVPFLQSFMHAVLRRLIGKS